VKKNRQKISRRLLGIKIKALKTVSGTVQKNINNNEYGTARTEATITAC
jgi:hypothetical protein